MSISVQVYSNANSSSKSITFDFVSDILAPTDVAANTSSNAFYFKITAGGTQDNNVAFPVKIVRSLSELVLNKQKQRINNVATDYDTISEFITDYIYDYINGHTANLYSSGCTAQNPMKF
jgi:hypothetical protein